jgi:hypothetical protein
MKQISLENLARTSAWHEAMALGQMDGGRFNLLLTDEAAATVPALMDFLIEIPSESLPVASIQLRSISNAAPATRSELTIAGIETICEACPWNMDWICQHPGCLPCKQRAAGGLKAIITQPGSHCPAGKW